MNIMYTAFLLVVLFEGVVAVEFPGRRQETAGLGLFKLFDSNKNIPDVKVSTSDSMLSTNLMMLSSICISDVAV